MDLLCHDGILPVLKFDVSNGKKHDVWAAHDMKFPTKSIVVADRAFADYTRMDELDNQGVFFVIRGKERYFLKYTAFWRVGPVKSCPVREIKSTWTVWE